MAQPMQPSIKNHLGKNMNTTRRQWFKSAAGLSAGFVALPSLVEQLMAAPVSEAERLHQSFANGKLVRLGSNENPYGPSPKAREAVTSILSEGNRYAFEAVTSFKKVLADAEGVTPDHILIGNGSSELLCVAGIGIGLEGKRVVSPFPTFRLLMEFAERMGAAWDKVPLDESLTIDLNALASAIRDDTKMVFLVNPNNPTGTLVEWEKYADFCNEISKRVTVYSDEAYVEFLEPADQRSMVELVRKGSDVIVSKTFSKVYGLAGLRLGYLIAQPDRIKQLSKFQMGGGVNINQAVLAAAKASMGDAAFMNMTREKNALARKVLEDYLTRKGWFYGKSHANLLFFPAPLDGKTILAKTEEAGYQIRIWDYAGKEWCRVSIGTFQEMQGFVKAFDKIVA
jgi:histidinol-phosphate aminotransferase